MGAKPIIILTYVQNGCGVDMVEYEVRLVGQTIPFLLLLEAPLSLHVKN